MDKKKIIKIKDQDEADLENDAQLAFHLESTVAEELKQAEKSVKKLKKKCKKKEDPADKKELEEAEKNVSTLKEELVHLKAARFEG